MHRKQRRRARRLPVLEVMFRNAASGSAPEPPAWSPVRRRARPTPPGEAQVGDGAAFADRFCIRSAMNMTTTPIPTPMNVKSTRRPSAA